MNEILSKLDMDLKDLFTKGKYDEMNELLISKDDNIIIALSDYSWNIIKKYYEAENFQLLFAHMNFVAYTCYIVEYTHNRGLLSDEVFGESMSVYNAIYELRNKD